MGPGKGPSAVKITIPRTLHLCNLLSVFESWPLWSVCLPFSLGPKLRCCVSLTLQPTGFLSLFLSESFFGTYYLVLLLFLVEHKVHCLAINELLPPFISFKEALSLFPFAGVFLSTILSVSRSPDVLLALIFFSVSPDLCLSIFVHQHLCFVSRSQFLSVSGPSIFSPHSPVT